MSIQSPVRTTSIHFDHVVANAATSAPAADFIVSGFPEYEVDLTPDQTKELNRIAEQIINSQTGPNPVSAVVIVGHADRDLRPNNPKRLPGETRTEIEKRMSDSRAQRHCDQRWVHGRSDPEKAAAGIRKADE